MRTLAYSIEDMLNFFNLFNKADNNKNDEQ